MKTKASKRNNESTGHHPALPAKTQVQQCTHISDVSRSDEPKRVGLGHFFFKSREDQRAFASTTGKEKRDQGTDAPKGKRWAVAA